MLSLVDLVPVSSLAAYPATRSQLNKSDNYQPEQLLNHCMSATFWHSENPVTPKQASATEENSKLDKLQAELEALKLLGGGIVHDLGNVLTVIMGNLELVRLYCRQRQVQNDLEQILFEMEEATILAKALHTQLYQHLQGATLLKENVALEELLEVAIRLGLSKSGVECHFNRSTQLPVVQASRLQIIEVIENLVLNAAQAMPNGGQIEVKAQAAELAENQVQGLRAGHYVEISVSDNGPGIAPEHLSMIFAPHFTTKEKGQGLGLAMCYSIIQRHSGQIEVESQLGVGTTFRVWLPLSA